MAEQAIMSLLLQKVGTMLSEEANFLRGVRAGVEDIEHELIGMQNFLTTGEASIVKYCLDGVRDLAYDAEDCIDSFRLHIAAEYVPGKEDRCISFLDKGPHYLKTLPWRHQICKKINKIKAKAKRLHEIRSRYQPQTSSLTEQASRRNDAQSAAPCFDKDQLVSMEKRREQLKDLLLQGESQLTVISVVGMSGLGKTTVAFNLFEDESVKETFKYRAWIGVSQLSHSRVLLGLIYQVFEQGPRVLPQGLEFMTELQLANELKQFLLEERYMIILDDVRERSAWERIAGAFPVSKNGSRVMITSQIHDIASYDINSTCGYLTRFYQLPDLEKDEAWELFCSRAFRGFACPGHLKDVAERIVERCGGLPLAIVTAGGLLASKPQTLDEWNRLRDCLIPELQSNDRLASVQRILSLGYDDLPAHLKPCILCFGAFQETKQTRLMRIWIAEGFVQSVKGRTQEQVAMDYLKDLANRSMVQLSVDWHPAGRTTKKCRVHRFMHEILKFQCMEQSAYTLPDDEHDGNNNQHGRASPKPPSSKIRRLPVNSSQMYRDMASLLRRTDCGSSLRSLIIAIRDQTDPIPVPSPDLSKKFVMLRMLDLEGTNVSTLSKEIAYCRLLRYLSLRDTNVDSLPKSLGKLLNLETLDLRGTQIKTLPAEVTNLHRLRYLHVCPPPKDRTLRGITHASWYELTGAEGVSAPLGVRRLTSLVKLSLFDIGHDDVLKELRDLTQLRKLGIRCIRSKNGKDVCDAIQQMSCLRSLVLHSLRSVNADDDEPLDLQSLSSPPPRLEHLFLAGRLEKLPNWAQSLRFIEKIVLVGSRLVDDPFDAFEGLPNLTHLSLIEAFAGTDLRSSNGGFKQLKILHLSGLDKLESVTVAEGAMPALGTLSIWHCRQLQQVPSGIEQLTSLKELHFLGMQEEFEHKVMYWWWTAWEEVKHLRFIIKLSTFMKSQDGDGGKWDDKELPCNIMAEMEMDEEEEEEEEEEVEEIGGGRRIGSFVEQRDGDVTTWIRYNLLEGRSSACLD